jgi:PIN domain nuclease of toxin-antitoxin system
MGGVGVILLDTHALIWWANGDGERLSARARERLEEELARVERG